MEDIQSVLNEYGLRAEYIEPVSSKVWKVYTDHGVFALKKLEASRNARFTEQMIMLEEKGYRHFVPVYRNRGGEFLTGAGAEVCYLMPWLALEREEERDQKHEYLFKEIALLHQKTEKELGMRREDILRHYQRTKSEWEAQKRKYEEMVSRAETEWYMSPFQLQAAMYYRETISAVDFALSRLDEWQEAIKDKESSRIVLNHGQLSVRHFLYNDMGTGYFTNFEKTGYAPPANDLIVFYTRMFKTNPVMCTDCVNWFYTYHNVYPLQEEEIRLFLSYMAYPGAVFSVLDRYQTEKRIGEQEACTRLLKAYWQMKNAEPLVMNILETEENRKLQEETESPSS
ncbi:spore coat protein YsxE [Bacillus swezeyi]|uniref:Spore coat protein YsxE n=1 Tax=Bacillus swezeyi TaxID=1925020 RepID=A0A1R1RKD2_9BACI|nr:spore coat protein YsxE [Bacillus swezeyi]MEC1262911.1 spore coat protein YsxE [Bacillus swezeyi]MED2928230.1 spore coat protein YsxE [Bacillus swezeyi]MED2944771.1 spore coat protein YsxE [Bacillus swezeyi]MED2966345.1 spore coat protein YsxE [Bacillus swezeyi]MED2975371.1 spore coat protein YsxE [Bacillus swezeyi]